MAPERLRDANALSATANQLAAGLGVAVATVALRLGGGLTATPSAAYAVAFCLLGAVGLAATVGALRLHRGAGDAVRAGHARLPAAHSVEGRPSQIVGSPSNCGDRLQRSA